MALGAGTIFLAAGVVGCNALADDGAVPAVSVFGTANATMPSTATLTATSATESHISATSETSSDEIRTAETYLPEAGAAAAETTLEVITTGASPTVPDEPSATPGSVTAGSPTTTAPPQQILLPTLGVQAPVIPVGVESDGLMEIPEDVGTVGWYEYGPSPGDAAGSAVLTGHVNDRDQGLGVFSRIGDLNPGDTLQVVDSVGTTRTFSVIARETWPKPEVPLARLFDRSGEPRLVLITCGGIFDRSSGNYQDNIAVTAVPVAP